MRCRMLLLLLFMVPVRTQVLVRHPVPVLWMMPLSSGPPWANVTTAVVPAVHLALQDLQRAPPPLGNYELQLQLLDSQCDAATSLKALFDAMWAGPRYLLLLGGVCPSVTALIGRSLPALRLVQVSFMAPPPSSSNRKWSSNLFSTVPPDTALNLAVLKLLQHFGWQRVAVVAATAGGGDRLLQMKEDLMRRLQRVQVQVVESGSASEGCGALSRLKERDTRIILVLSEGSSTSEVFCCAHRLELFGPRYQWLLVGSGRSLQSLPSSACSGAAILAAANGSIMLQSRELGRSNRAGASGRTPEEYKDAYLAQQTGGSEVNRMHGFVYDAVWLAATAVSHVMEAAKLQERRSRNGSASEEQLHQLLLNSLRGAHFRGVTGDVSFGGGERMTSIDLIQLQGSSELLVGEFQMSNQQLNIKTSLLRFPGSRPPADCRPVLVQRQRLGILLSSIVSSAAAVTVAASLCLLVLALICGKHRCANLEEQLLLLLGVLLSSSSVLLSGLEGAPLSPATLGLLCSVRLWTLVVGHSLLFSSLFSRVWTVYRCCCSLAPRWPAGCVLPRVLLLLDSVVLTCWQVLDPLRWAELQQDSQGDGTDEDLTVRWHSELCSSENVEAWLTAIYGYKGPLLALGCFLSWKVKRSCSKQQTFTLLAITVFSVLGAATSPLASHNPPLHTLLTAALVLAADLLMLCLLLPASKQQQSDIIEEEEEHEEQEVEPLSCWNRRLKSRAAQLDAEIESVSRQLGGVAQQDFQPQLTSRHTGHVTHTAQVCSDDGNLKGALLGPDGANSPDYMWRRLSVQLPILHHSYLPASTSSLFGSREAFVHHDLFSC